MDEDFLNDAKLLFQNLLKEVHQSTTKYTGRGLIGHFKVILPKSFFDNCDSLANSTLSK